MCFLLFDVELLNIFQFKFYIFLQKNSKLYVEKHLLAEKPRVRKCQYRMFNRVLVRYMDAINHTVNTALRKKVGWVRQSWWPISWCWTRIWVSCIEIIQPLFQRTTKFRRIQFDVTHLIATWSVGLNFAIRIYNFWLIHKKTYVQRKTDSTYMFSKPSWIS